MNIWLLVLIAVLEAVLIGYSFRVKARKGRFPVIRCAVLSLLLLACFLIRAFVFVDYKGRETTGDYSIAETSAILVDPSRVETFESDGSNREIPVHFYYPAEAAEGDRFPLVVFSHGAFGYYQSNTSTYRELASNGYVVVSLDHPYHSFFCKDSSGKLITVDSGFMEDVMKVNDHRCSEKEILEITKGWLTLRTEDISCVLDAIECYNEEGTLDTSWAMGDRETKVMKALSLIDVDKIGVMGHSLGGASAVMLGRTRTDVDAVIDLDGTMLGENLEVVTTEPFSFEGEEYTEINVINEEPYPVPILAIDSALHHESRENAEAVGMPYANNTVRKNALRGYDTYILDTAHMNFTDLPLISPFLARMLGTGSVDAGACVDVMNQLVLDFFNATLKDMGIFEVEAYYDAAA